MVIWEPFLRALTPPEVVAKTSSLVVPASKAVCSHQATPRYPPVLASAQTLLRVPILSSGRTSPDGQSLTIRMSGSALGLVGRTVILPNCTTWLLALDNSCEALVRMAGRSTLTST